MFSSITNLLYSLNEIQYATFLKILKRLTVLILIFPGNEIKK